MTSTTNTPAAALHAGARPSFTPPRRRRRGASRLLLRRVVVAALGLLHAACAEPVLPPSPAAGTPRMELAEPGNANAAVYWNAAARQMVITKRSSTPFAIRGYAIVGVAQHNAALAATQSGGSPRPSVRAAISGASVAALTYLYPDDAAELESRLEAYLAEPGSNEEDPAEVAAGLVIGRAEGARVVDRAKDDRFFAPGALTPPVGPGLWFSRTPPAGSLFGQAQTWFLLSSDQFRPAPHPEFGSPAFGAALTEVREISATRTPEQVAQAVYWDSGPGTHTPPGIWNEEAARLALQHRLDETRSAHLFALLNVVSFDGLVASHEAKYHYWLLRPSMASPRITMPIPLPNFPAYPSNHATISAGMARVLGRFFPDEAERLDGLAEEAAVSRVFGGIHYRFDGDAGLALGRQVAAWVLSQDGGQQPIGMR